MIQEPPIDALAQKIGSKYALCVVAAKRARQLLEQAQNYELPIKKRLFRLLREKFTKADWKLQTISGT